MSFNMVLLKDTEDSSNFFDEVVSTESKSIECMMLENNMNLHREMVEIDKEYYRALVENVDGNDETAKRIDLNKITRKAEVIFAYLLNLITQLKRVLINSEINRKYFDRTVDKFKRLPNNKMREMKFFVLFNYCDLNSINTDDILNALSNITDYIDRIISGEDMNDIPESIKESTFHELAAAIKKVAVRSKFTSAVDDAASFKAFVSNNMYYKEKKEMMLSEYVDYLSDRRKIYRFKPSTLDRCIDPITKMLKSYKEKVTNEKKLKVSENINKNLGLLLDYLKVTVYNYVWFINTIYDNEYMYMNTVNKLYENITHVEKVEESGFIHGEPFNSDTLFDNEDLRDFNPTEWLNLELETANFEIDYIVNDSYKRIALKEANILTDEKDDKFNRLIVMREAEEQNAEKQIDEIIEKVNETVGKFFTKLSNKSKENLHFINDNKAAVNARIKINEVRSKGDIIAGMYRVQNSINLVGFSNNMKADMKDKVDFFKAHVMQSMNKESKFSKRKIEFTEGLTIAAYAKSYYGASMPDDKYKVCVYTGIELEQNKANIAKFISNPIAYLSSIKQDIKKLGDVTKRIYRQNKRFVNTVEKQQTTTQESYYSELYDCVITEAEIKMGKTTFSEKRNDKITEKANYHKVYLDCYKDIILAKITAIEFIINEFSQIIKAHAISNGSKQNKPEEALEEE